MKLYAYKVTLFIAGTAPVTAVALTETDALMAANKQAPRDATLVGRKTERWELLDKKCNLLYS